MADREKVIIGLECCMAEKICASKCPYKGQCDDGGYYYSKAIEDAISLLKTSVSQGVFDQIKWERDMVIAQLEEIGKGLGEKMDNVKEALKAQEPVPPKVDIDTYACRVCGTRLERQSLIGSNAVLAETFNYCPNCGKKVAWHDLPGKCDC